MAKEIYSSEEFRQIYNNLTKEEDPYSFPVRGMLAFIMSGKIKYSKVFVDQWPQFNSVACIQMSLEYSKVDVDLLTVYSKNYENFTKFFTSLANKRDWQNRGLLIMYLRKDFVQSAKNLLPKMENKDLGSLIFFEQLSGEELEKMYRKLVAEELKKMPGVKLGNAIQDDVQTIVDLYPSPIPAKEEMFRWMVDNLPSTALRDAQGKLISWCLTYPCGVGAVMYVQPPYRRTGIAGLVGVDVMNKLCNLYPGKRYGAISPDNTASISLNLKFGSQQTDAMVNWVIFTPIKTAKL